MRNKGKVSPVTDAVNNIPTIAKSMMLLGMAYFAYNDFFDSDFDVPRFNTDSMISNAAWENSSVSFVQASSLTLMAAAAYSVTALQSGSSIVSSVATALASMMLGVSDLVQPVIAQGSDTTFFQVFGDAGNERGNTIKATADGGS